MARMAFSASHPSPRQLGDGCPVIAGGVLIGNVLSPPMWAMSLRIHAPQHRPGVRLAAREHLGSSFSSCPGARCSRRRRPARLCARQSPSLALRRYCLSKAGVATTASRHQSWSFSDNGDALCVSSRQSQGAIVFRKMASACVIRSAFFMASPPQMSIFVCCGCMLRSSGGAACGGPARRPPPL